MASILIAVLGAGEIYSNEREVFVQYGVNPNTLPDKVTDESLPKSEPGSVDSIVGFCAKDMSEKDMTGVSLDCLSRFTYDTYTKWPNTSKLPVGFEPSGWLEKCRDPGLGVRALHAEGITGKGVSVAIFDKPILATHSEIRENIVYRQIGEDDRTHFHGMACASILCGKTCGVAPGAKLYYFAVPDNGENFDNYTEAMDALIALNESLPEKNKVRLVSISDGLRLGDSKWEKWRETTQKAATAGIMVFYSNSVSEQGFALGGCSPNQDRNDPVQHRRNKRYHCSRKSGRCVLVPADYRTTGTNRGEDSYIYWSDGGFSWLIPYVAGLAALGLQVNPSLTYDEVCDLLVKTRVVNSEGDAVVNPRAFLNALRARTVVIHETCTSNCIGE